ncbi:MAG: hypothetical protein WKF31_13095 [Thermoleophilaceae bacterium]
MLAVLYDIHGNLPALEAGHRRRRPPAPTPTCSAATTPCLARGPRRPSLRPGAKLDARWICRQRGALDREPRRCPGSSAVQRAVQFCRGRLGPSGVEDLGRLNGRPSATARCSSTARPPRTCARFMPAPAEDEPELLAGVKEPRLVFGHTHLQFRRRADGGPELVNPGSVGMPFDGDARAAYALFAENGDVDLRRVEYDHARSVAAVRALGEWAEPFARRLAAEPPSRHWSRSTPRPPGQPLHLLLARTTPPPTRARVPGPVAA